jgi:hypothetical protein
MTAHDPAIPAVAARRSAIALLTAPIEVGRMRLPPIGIVVLAAIGAVLLLVVAVNRWATPSDEHAYWLAAQRLLAGQPLYDPTAYPGTPYAYWYPPPFAQALMPVAALLPSLWFTGIWTLLLLACLWYLGLRNGLIALALVAFLPVAVELWYRNVHLVLAVLLVLAIRRWPVLFAVGAAIKIAPGLGIVYLAARGRWRDALLTLAAGAALLGVSVVLAPGAWAQFIDVVIGRGPSEMPSLVPVPYGVRAIIGLVLAVVAGRIAPRYGEPLLVVAVMIASPTLWATAFSLLIAIVPLVARPARATRPARLTANA